MATNSKPPQRDSSQRTGESRGQSELRNPDNRRSNSQRPRTGRSRAVARHRATKSNASSSSSASVAWRQAADQKASSSKRPATSHRKAVTGNLRIAGRSRSSIHSANSQTRSSSAQLGRVIGVTIVVAVTIAILGYGVTYRMMSTSGDNDKNSGFRVANDVASFTTADEGSCLNWKVSPSGQITDYEPAQCSDTHRFEISLRTNLGLYPSKEFGDNAALPTLQRQAELRTQLCERPTLNYLQGKYDPEGKFSIAPIFPSPSAWEAGDRTMLCGLQVTDNSGTPMVTKGAARDVDQAVVYQPGQCVSYENSRRPSVVECAKPHAMEATSVIDLTQHFPKGAPTITQQDDVLKKICTQAAFDYMGSEEQLYQSTLTPFWTTLDPRRWNLGSRSVNCGLIAPTDSDQFSALAGNAKEKFTINGKPPVAPPSRTPLISETQNQPGNLGDAAKEPAGQRGTPSAGSV